MNADHLEACAFAAACRQLCALAIVRFSIPVRVTDAWALRMSLSLVPRVNLNLQPAPASSFGVVVAASVGARLSSTDEAGIAPELSTLNYSEHAGLPDILRLSTRTRRLRG